MDYLIGVLFGLAAGLLLANASRWQKGAKPTGTGPSVPASSAVVGPAAAAPEEAQSLTARLHAFESVFAPLVQNFAHPRELTEQSAFLEAAKLLASPSAPLDTVLQYARGVNWALQCVALAALKDRPDGAQAVEEIVAHFDKLNPWAMHFALEFFVAVNPRPAVGAPAVGAKEWWGENLIIPIIFREYLVQRARLGDTASFGTALHSSAASPPALIRAFLQRVDHPLAIALVQQLGRIERSSVDRVFLTSFGRFWIGPEQYKYLIEPEIWSDALETTQAACLSTPPRSLLVSGDHRVGKTSFLRLLAERLEREGWTIFEASGADLMAGQQWFGQLEGRIQRTVEEVTAAKKLIWYIPDILQVARSGTHQGQAASILDQILPAIHAGRLIVWTEATRASTARLLQMRASLRGVFEVIRLEPQSQEETSVLAQAFVDRLSDDLELAIDSNCVPVAVSSARQYLSASNLPGSVLDLIKLTVTRAAKGGASEVAAHEVIITLSQLSGLPMSILDSSERVDLTSIRNHFSSCVIGQNEAVTAIVDRIAMLKAGLNDPGKPIGVLLFAGPTGTGKTELAKTLSEYLFGSVDRLIRLDMSEFQGAESTFKILGDSGAAGETDSLISRVRKQPFSVILLDEFEKAHASIWDLFLQVFDEGRLTDSMGHVADFRHCMIILTTNLGATSHRTSGLGFAPGADTFSEDQIMRAIGQTFRPEFQNRLDKVIVFNPLTRSLMRDILKKELSRVLERRGLKDREWAVEWEASAEEFLLEKGFSPEMGARPLKRAIDQYVIAPLAATIVERRFPEGDQFVFVRSDGRAIQAEFVDPDSDAAATTPAGDGDTPERLLALPAMILAPTGAPAELKTLHAEYAALAQILGSVEWEELKARCADNMAAADFWSRAGRHETLARYALMDRVQAAMSTAEGLRARLTKGAERTGKSSRELVARLALQLHLIKEGTRDVFESAPIEVALSIEPVFEKLSDNQATRQWCQQLLGMYRAWANNRHMQLSESPRDASSNLPWLLVSGFGAHRLLAQEVGLHVLEFAETEKGPSRATARVRVAVMPLGDLSRAKLRDALTKAFEQGPSAGTVVRRYRREPSPLVRNMSGSWRTGKVDAVLAGDFDLIAASQS